MMSELALSIDCGTQSLRALLFDSGGHLLDGESVLHSILQFETWLDRAGSRFILEDSDKSC